MGNYQFGLHEVANVRVIVKASAAKPDPSSRMPPPRNQRYVDRLAVQLLCPLQNEALNNVDSPEGIDCLQIKLSDQIRIPDIP